MNLVERNLDQFGELPKKHKRINKRKLNKKQRIKNALNPKYHWNNWFPYYELCWHSWCFRFMTYQYRCGKHQEDT